MYNLESIGPAVSEEKIFKDNFKKKKEKFVKNRNSDESAWFNKLDKEPPKEHPCKI